VVNEVNGKWDKALQVPGTVNTNEGLGLGVFSVSCSSTGNCSAGGESYLSRAQWPGDAEAFTVNEVNGKWRRATEVPGIATMDVKYGSSISSVSCSSPGDCSAGGYFNEANGDREAFVVDEDNGTWAKAIEVPGTAQLNLGGSASINSVSCSALGECSAGGNYSNKSSSSENSEVFLDTERNGKWETAIEVPGTAETNIGDSATLNSISCSKPGSCSAGGDLSPISNSPGDGVVRAFLVSETGGKWSEASEVPGTAGPRSDVNSISCVVPDDCAAGGGFTPVDAEPLAFVVSSTP
jgi:hypothetical protein